MAAQVGTLNSTEAASAVSIPSVIPISGSADIASRTTESDARQRDRERGAGLRLNEHLEHEDGPLVFRHALKLGLEGIVSK
jgi:hypothetical protein